MRMDPVWFIFGILNVCEFKYQKYIIFISLSTLIHFKIYDISTNFFKKFEFFKGTLKYTFHLVS